MIVAPALEKLNYRLARYYLDKLRTAESAYQYGGEHSIYALAMFECEWPHIQQWQAWSAAHASDDNQAATLCKEYSQVGAELLILRQHPQERLEWLEAGLAATYQLGDTSTEMVHLYLLARVHHVLGSLILAQEYAEKALALARQLGNPLYICRSLLALARVFLYKAEYERSQATFDQALVLSIELDTPLEMAEALTGLGAVAFRQSDYIHAYDYDTKALKIYEEQGQPHYICSALRNLSSVAAVIGDKDAAIKYAERGAVLARNIGYQELLASCLGTLGLLATEQGNFDEACEYLQQSLDITRLLGDPFEEVGARIRLGLLLLRLGDLSAVLVCFEAVLPLANKSGFRWHSAIALWAMAQVFRRKGDLLHTGLKLHAGLEIALDIKNINIQTAYLLEAALLWHDRGQIEQAATWAALLQANIKELDVKQLAAFDDLKQKLKDSLGQAQFTTALEDGRNLNLDSVLEEILTELRQV